MICTNAGQIGEHPHFSWIAPDHPVEAVITYDIYWDVLDGYHKISPSPFTTTEYTDTGVQILKFGNQSYHYVTARAAHSPESEPSNTVVINTDTAAKPARPTQGSISASGNEGTSDAPTLLRNSPNPFNATTTLTYRLPNDGSVELSVHDLSGRQVAALVSGHQNAGLHQIVFDGSEHPSGVYIAVLRFGGQASTRKIPLLK